MPPGIRRSSATLAAACAVILALAGCSTPTSRSEAADEAADAASACAYDGVALSSLPLADDPRTAEGPSTACIGATGIDPVDDDSDPVLPVTVTDAEGREVEVTDVSRILPIDISGTIAATVFGLGLGDNVVGRDSSTQFAGTEDLPVVTQSGHSLNAEAILATAPTVILTDTTIGPKEVRQQLRDAGIAVVVISSDRRIDTTGDLVAEIAGALGVEPRGAALAADLAADVESAVDEVAEIAPDAASARPRMLFLYVRGSANVYYIFGKDSGADSLIEAVGGIDVAGEIGWEGMKPMTAEALVAANPDVLVMMTDGLESVGGVDGLIDRIPAVAETAAGQHRRVVDMADAEILSFGPRTADVIRGLAGALYAPAASGLES